MARSGDRPQLTTGHSLVLHKIQLQKMGRARDTRVIAADQLFATQGGLLQRQLQYIWHKGPQIILHSLQVLRGGGPDVGFLDQAGLVQPVVVIQAAAWRFGDVAGLARFRLRREAAGHRWVVAGLMTTDLPPII